jgi:hypothetical protein
MSCPSWLYWLFPAVRLLSHFIIKFTYVFKTMRAKPRQESGEQRNDLDTGE